MGCQSGCRNDVRVHNVRILVLVFINIADTWNCLVGLNTIDCNQRGLTRIITIPIGDTVIAANVIRLHMSLLYRICIH